MVPSVLAGLLVIGVFLVLFVQVYYGGGYRLAVPGVSQGYLDLTRWDWAEESQVALDGQWEFYPGLLLTPGGIDGMDSQDTGWGVYDWIPDPWEQAAGCGTYRLRIDLPPGENRLALRLPAISSSYRLFVNGREIRRAGNPADSRGNYRGRYFPGLELVAPEGNRLEIVLAAANYVLETGGIRNSLVLGKPEKLFLQYHSILALDFFLLGTSLVMAFYHFFMYLFRRRQREFLIFSLLCLILGLRLLIHNEHYLYKMFPLFPFRLYAGFQVATFYLFGGLLVAYFHSVFPHRMGEGEVRFWWGITLLSVVMGFAAPYALQFQWMHVYQIILLGLVLRFFYLLVLEVRQGDINALMILAGYGIMFFFAVHDILLTFGILRGRMLFHLGFFFYILLHSSGLSWKNGVAFRRSERTAQQYKNLLEEREALQRNLEIAVEEKSIDLRTAVGDLKKARDEADRANEAKTRFLANVSHELRTPLNGVIGFTEILQEINPTEEQREYLELVLQESRAMLDLINELLDLSKIEGNQFHLHWERLSWGALYEWLDGSMRARVNRQGLDFSLNWDHALPAWSEGDPRRLRQVLGNLIGNAIKFTPEGLVEVSFQRTVMQNGRDAVSIEVRDTGIGIPETAREKIFEPFFQLDQGNSRIFQGTGLGTTISQMLVEMMGGRIGIKDSSGEGTIFYCRIPLVDASFEEEPVRGEPEEAFSGEEEGAFLAGRKILVAEDYPMNRKVVLWHLKRWGADTVTADNGLEAVEAFDSSFDLVLMDVQMPVMDGLLATVQLRTERDCRIPIIGLTANAYAADREACLDSGMDDVFSKPVRRGELRGLLARYLGGGTEPIAGGERPGDSPLSDLSVLDWKGLCREMGEDRDFCRELVQNYLDLGRQRLRDLEQAGDPGRERIHRDFHTLKGGAMNVMASRAAGAAAEAEAFFKGEPESRDVPEALTGFIRRLREELDRLESQVQGVSS